jgi:hypothetical protein
VEDLPPVAEIEARFVDEIVAREVAEALNAWFRWIVSGSEGAPPALFEPLGVPTEEYAWSLGEDVDWTIGPHARAIGDDVRLSVHTRDTHLHLGGLLRRLGALSVRVVRDEPPA